MKRNRGEIKKPWWFKCLKAVMRLFIKKPDWIGDVNFEDGAIYLSNHAGACGPLTYELYFPKPFLFWGTHEMMGTFLQRWKYLAFTYFYRKKHICKFLSVIIATVACPFIHLFYLGLRPLPTYTDARLKTTIYDSVKVLEKNCSIIIFPEDSADGYHDVLKHYFAGFMKLAECTYKTIGKNLSIFNMYLDKKPKRVFVAPKKDYLTLASQGKNIREVANDLKDEANMLKEKTSL